MYKRKLEQEFEEFFMNCLKDTDEKELMLILKPLKMQLLKQQLKKVLKIASLLATICFAIYFNDTLNWNVCAVTRIIMIQLLPVWNWTHLANAKCLVPKSTTAAKSNEVSRVLSLKDCRACEHFDTIDVVKETSYKFIHDKFLIRGLPIIISDTTTTPNIPESVEDFIEEITRNMSSMVREEACDLDTNLMMTPYATVADCFAILSEISEDSGEMPPWFVSFRNCRFNALKASRTLMQKPYFYPRNMQAPSSSWIILSQNYKNYSNELKLYGLIIVTQLKGSIGIILKAKNECHSICNDLRLKIFSGESLVFLSNLWTFTYQHSAETNFTLTFITETDFN